MSAKSVYCNSEIPTEGCQADSAALDKIQLSGKVDAAFLRLSALEDAAQGNLLPVASIRIILLLTTAAAKAPVVEASTRAARVVSNIAVLPKSTIGNAPTA